MRFAGWNRVAVFGCGMQLNPLPWDYSPAFSSPYATLCTYEPALGAWATCADQVILENSLHPEQEFNSTIGFVNLVCKKAGGNLAQYTLEEWRNALDNATDYIQPVPKPPVTQPITYPVKLDDEHRRTMIRGVLAEFSNLDASNDAALWIYFYFALLLLAIVTVPRVIPRTWYHKLKSKLVIPSLWLTSVHSKSSFWAMGGYMPDSEEACILLGFLFAHSLALTVNYSIDYDEILEPVFLQGLQALGNRSGILSFALLPILVAFTTRSAVLMKLTGFKYSTFLVLHRWIGRTIIFDAIIHSIAFYAHESLTGMFETTETAPYWWIAGVVATIMCCVILVMGSGAFRKRWYETFLYTHIAMAMVFFYECWRHVETFGWLGWLKCSVGLWIAERCYRLALIWKNGVCVAEVQYVDPSTNREGVQLITLVVPKPTNWHMRPSQYAFVYFLLPAVFWQSHPFTVTDAGDTLKLVIAVKGGVTSAIRRALDSRQANDTSLNLSILLEGPYGVPPEMHQFEQALLISGGSGVPGPLGLALGALQHTEPENIHVVVVVRDWAVLDAYEDQILAVKSAGIRIDVHYTGKRENSKWAELMEIRTGRPDISALVTEVTGSTAVVCCGPPGLNDLTRNIVAKAVYSNPEMDYFEEYQVW